MRRRKLIVGAMAGFMHWGITALVLLTIGVPIRLVGGMTPLAMLVSSVLGSLIGGAVAQRDFEPPPDADDP